MRHLSYSAISTYTQCPLRYKLIYIDGLKEKAKLYFSFGKTLHAAAQFIFQVKTPPPPSLEKVLRFYEAKWIPDGYADKEEEENYFQEGKRIITGFYENQTRSFKPPLAVEYPFRFPLEDLEIKGYIDRIDKLPSGKFEVIDYKSNKAPFTQEFLKEDLQLTIYQIAVEQVLNLEVGKLTLYHFRSHTPFSVEPRSRDKIEATRAYILGIAQKIKDGHFPAKENPFCPCDFPQYCPYYKDIYKKEEMPQDETERLEIKDIVEEYVNLRKQIDLRQGRLDELVRLIGLYCEKRNISRIFGKGFAITRVTGNKKGFDPEKIRRLLEPEGLWRQVLRYDDKLVRELLEDPKIKATLKQKIISTEEVRKIFHFLRYRKLSEEDEMELGL